MREGGVKEEKGREGGWVKRQGGEGGRGREGWQGWWMGRVGSGGKGEGKRGGERGGERRGAGREEKAGSRCSCIITHTASW